jgi:hypothetical protein
MDNKGKIHKDQNEIYKNEKDNEIVNSMVIAGDKIITIDKNNILNINNMHDLNNMYSQYIKIDSNKEAKLYASIDQGELYIINGSKIIVFDINDYNIKKEIYTGHTIEKFAVTNEKDLFYITYNNFVECYRSDEFVLAMRKSLDDSICCINIDNSKQVFIGLQNGKVLKLS